MPDEAVLEHVAPGISSAQLPPSAGAQNRIGVTSEAYRTIYTYSRESVLMGSVGGTLVIRTHHGVRGPGFKTLLPLPSICRGD